MRKKNCCLLIAVWGLVVAFAVLLRPAAARAAGDDAPPAMVFMKQDVVIADRGRAELKMPERQQVLPCARATDRGYMVQCRDVLGNPRMACLPFSDQWGHATARAWLYDPSLKPNTIVVQIPLALEPGSFLLGAGEEYPLLSSDEDSYSVLYVFGDYCRTVAVSRARAGLRPAPVPEKDPAAIHENDLADAVARNLDESARLAAGLQPVEERNARIEGLLRRLNETEIEIVRLRAATARAEAIRETLMDYRPETGRLRRAKADELGEAMTEEGRLAAKSLAAGLDAGAVGELQAQVQDAGLAVTRARLQAMKSRSELDAVMAFASGKAARAERQALELKLDSAAVQNAGKSGELRAATSVAEMLRVLRLEIDQISAENKELAANLKSIAVEIEALLKDPPPAE